MADLSKDKRIRKEFLKFKKICADLPNDKKSLAETLCQRLAFMLITLEDLEEDITLNGATEIYQSGKDTPPMTKQSASAQVYNSLIKNYNGCIRELSNLLPKQVETKTETKSEPNEFEKMMKKKMARVK